MQQRHTHIVARLDRGLNVSVRDLVIRVLRRVAGRDAVQQAVVKNAELVEAAEVVALEAGFGQRLDLGVDAVHLGCGERRVSLSTQVIE